MTQHPAQLLSNAQVILQELPVERALLGSLVLEGLRHVLDTAQFPTEQDLELFPFTKHFLQELASLPQADQSHWINLFEDLALLFRKRSLSCEMTHPVEQRIMNAFEQSGNWHPADGTLVSQWYWETLPQLCSVR